METVLRVFQVFLAIGLIGVVLLQKSEGGGLGIGSSSSMGSFMSVRGTANFLSRMTAILAALFMATCLTLALIAKPAQAPKSIFDTPSPVSSAPVPQAPGSEAPAAEVPVTPPSVIPPATTPPATTPPATTPPEPAPAVSQPPAAAAPVAPVVAPEPAPPAKTEPPPAKPKHAAAKVKKPAAHPQGQ